MSCRGFASSPIPGSRRATPGPASPWSASRAFGEEPLTPTSRRASLSLAFRRNWVQKRCSPGGFKAGGPLRSALVSYLSTVGPPEPRTTVRTSKVPIKAAIKVLLKAAVRVPGKVPIKAAENPGQGGSQPLLRQLSSLSRSRWIWKMPEGNPSSCQPGSSFPLLLLGCRSPEGHGRMWPDGQGRGRPMGSGGHPATAGEPGCRSSPPQVERTLLAAERGGWWLEGVYD